MNIVKPLGCWGGVQESSGCSCSIKGLEASLSHWPAVLTLPFFLPGPTRHTLSRWSSNTPRVREICRAQVSGQTRTKNRFSERKYTTQQSWFLLPLLLPSPTHYLWNLRCFIGYMYFSTFSSELKYPWSHPLKKSRKTFFFFFFLGISCPT